MHSGSRGMLLSEFWICIPAGIEQYKKRPDFVFLGDAQKNIDALLETFRILLPEQVVQKDAHGVEAERLRPTEFGIDALGIKGRGLPHFQLIDGCGWNVVAADKPWLTGVPLVRGFLGPTRCLRMRTIRQPQK